jgi:hypothetical protein
LRLPRPTSVGRNEKRVAVKQQRVSRRGEVDPSKKKPEKFARLR